MGIILGIPLLINNTERQKLSQQHWK